MWNTNKTHRNGVNKQHTHTPYTQKNNTGKGYLNYFTCPSIFMGKNVTPPLSPSHWPTPFFWKLYPHPL